MKIVEITQEQIENFQLFDENNEGESLIGVEVDGQIVAYAQHTEETIYFLESELKGAGRFLIEHLQSEYDYLLAANVEATAEGFYQKMGFEKAGSDGFGGFNMDWEA